MKETPNNAGMTHKPVSGITEGTIEASKAAGTKGVTSDAPFNTESSPGTAAAGYYRGAKGRESMKNVKGFDIVGDGGSPGNDPL